MEKLFSFFEKDLTGRIPGDVQYRVIHKTERMLHNLNTYAAQEDESEQEFLSIGKLTAELIAPTAMTKEGSQLMDRNRYQDMIPYDKNIVRLKKKIGL